MIAEAENRLGKGACWLLKVHATSQVHFIVKASKLVVLNFRGGGTMPLHLGLEEENLCFAWEPQLLPMQIVFGPYLRITGLEKGPD